MIPKGRPSVAELVGSGRRHQAKVEEEKLLAYLVRAKGKADDGQDARSCCPNLHIYDTPVVQRKRK
jgi:hypothetical protein